MSASKRISSGFTIIELLVVIAIIALLVGLLVPTLSHARTAARVAATTKQMQTIIQACEHYYSDFNAYPGPVADNALDGANAKFSGAQNLYLGLTRRFYPKAPSAANTQVPGLQIWFDNDSTKPLANYSVMGPGSGLTTNTAEPNEPPSSSFAAYLTPATAEISTQAHSAATNGLTLDSLPCFVDGAFGSSSKPILYYRQVYKWDPENATGIVANTPFASRTTMSAPASGQACFYASTNTLVDTSSPDILMGNNTGTPLPLDMRLTNDTTGSGKLGPLKGSIVLISAGADRFYGRRPNPDGTMSNTCDDIIMSSGH